MLCHGWDRSSPTIAGAAAVGALEGALPLDSGSTARGRTPSGARISKEWTDLLGVVKVSVHEVFQGEHLRAGAGP